MWYYRECSKRRNKNDFFSDALFLRRFISLSLLLWNETRHGGVERTLLCDVMRDVCDVSTRKEKISLWSSSHVSLSLSTHFSFSSSFGGKGQRPPRKKGVQTKIIKKVHLEDDDETREWKSRRHIIRLKFLPLSLSNTHLKRTKSDFASLTDGPLKNAFGESSHTHFAKTSALNIYN